MYREDKDKLITAYVPMIKRMAARMYIPTPEILDKDDLVSHGLLGLLDAADKYDPGRDISFDTYAGHRIRGAMLDCIRSASFSPRSVNEKIKQYRQAEDRLMLEGKDTDINSVAQEMGVASGEVHRIVSHISLRSVVSLDRMLWSDDGDEVAVSSVVSADSSLDPAGVFEQRESQMILFEAIGKLPERDQQILALYYIEEMTLKEIAAVYDLTEGRVSQLHSRAILRLRTLLKEQEAS